jgi:serine/threonine protein kinase
MEYASNGSLDRIVNLVHQNQKSSFLTRTGKAIIICGIILGMRFMHSHNFVHQDLKPSKILLNVAGQTLICDFGTSRCQAIDRTPTHDTGTPHYAAPELFEEEFRTEKVDIFSFGLILYEILVGRAFFPKSVSPAEIIRWHKNGERLSIPDTVFPTMKTLIWNCCSSNPCDRPSLGDILEYIESNPDQMLEDADEATVRQYVIAVRDWERMHDAKISAAR